jgi:hypothetical protein
MRHSPALYSAYGLFTMIKNDMWSDQKSVTDYGYVPARPLGGMHSRLKLAWMVFTGRADVLHWPGQE